MRQYNRLHYRISLKSMRFNGFNTEYPVRCRSCNVWRYGNSCRQVSGKSPHYLDSCIGKLTVNNMIHHKFSSVFLGFI
ncbi:hypothetical protein Barb7_00458 [Bacteroidales bacterium Barb7]|nr:hypothetical protein Barb7_00458 [Bacteroidales bacterium Barb7]